MWLMLLLAGTSIAMAQTQVQGTVVDDTGEPVIGASVVVKSNPSQGTVTDIDGKFNLSVQAGEMLTVSYVGYKTQDVAARAGMRVTLAADTEVLDELIVVAYGTAKKSSFTGSATAVSGEKIGKIQASDVTKALEGMVSGLSVTSSSGRAGTATTMRVRGIGSLNASSAPLIILDGAPYDGDINSINTKDVENISVLKDAASAALYGARGANGVILITTKNGKEGQVQVNFDARLGVNQRGVPEYDVLTDPGEYYRLTWEALKNQRIYTANASAAVAGQWASANLVRNLGYNIYGVPNNQVVDANGVLTSSPIIYEDAASFNDWRGYLFKPQTRQEYNLSITKGSDKSKVYFSLGYLDDKGINPNTGFDRLSTRLAYDSEITSWLKVTASSQLSKTTTKNTSDESSNFSNTFMWSRMIAPIYPIYKHDAAGKLIRDAAGNLEFDDSNARQYGGGSNILKQLQLNKQENNQFYLTQNLRADVTLPYNFKFNTTATFNGHWSRYTDYKTPLVGDGQAYGGILKKQANENYSLNWNQILTWDKKFGALTVNAMLGHENFAQRWAYMVGEKRGMLDPNISEFISAANMATLSSYTREYKLEGWFGQVTADYDDKYYLSGSLRQDGSSIFHPDHRWGTFWSLGGSWRINKEEFLQDVKAIDNLKLRVSYGMQGNDYLLKPDGYRSYAPYSDLYLIGSTGNASTYQPRFKGTKEITWEKNGNFNAGLEFSLWTGLLAGEFDFFTRRTTDMLFNLPIPSTTGFSSKPVNFGVMDNTGFEFNLSSNVYSSKKINVTLAVNGTTYKNTIRELPEEFRENGISTGFRIIREGGGIYDYWMPKYAGVDPETGDALFYMYDDKTSAFVATPSAKYSSANKHKQFVGSAIPKLAGGISATVNAYGFDLSMQFAYRIGGIVYDGNYASLMTAGDLGTNWHRDILNRWTLENKATNTPRIQNSAQSLNNNSDRFLIDGSYFAFNNLTVGYTLPASLMKSVGMKNVRIYFSGDNLGLFSKRKGLDPRVAISGDQRTNVNSAIRALSVGLSATL